MKTMVKWNLSKHNCEMVNKVSELNQTWIKVLGIKANIGLLVICVNVVVVIMCAYRIYAHAIALMWNLGLNSYEQALLSRDVDKSR